MSIERKVTYWEKPGKEHSEATLKIALNAAKDRDIDTVLVSSTTGYTAELAVPIFKDSGVKVVVVTHATGYREKGVQMMKEETRKTLKAAGFKVLDIEDGYEGAGLDESIPDDTIVMYKQRAHQGVCHCHSKSLTRQFKTSAHVYVILICNQAPALFITFDLCSKIMPH